MGRLARQGWQPVPQTEAGLPGAERGEARLEGAGFRWSGDTFES